LHGLIVGSSKPIWKLIAVIVSGYDGDGAAALCGIKEVGGITIAQKLETARQPDMPRSAIASGCIDFVLSPEDIAQEIARIAHDDLVAAPTSTAGGKRRRRAPG
jgi:two-component system, chemotaxis family, protein-glutamate methylesterase/glutaminase